MSEGAPEPELAPEPALAHRGGPQQIPRPATARRGPGASWSQPDASRPTTLAVADVRDALVRRGAPPAFPDEVPTVTLPGPAGRPAAVLCALFDESDQVHVVLTRRSSKLRSHAHQVSFPGGRIDPGERPVQTALREAHEEVGLDPASVQIMGELAQLRTVANPAPITPFVGALPGPPRLQPNPAEVERAFTVPVVELLDPEVYHEELWRFPDGVERSMDFFELYGDTVWGATARMLRELLDLIVPGPDPLTVA